MTLAFYEEEVRLCEEHEREMNVACTNIGRMMVRHTLEFSQIEAMSRLLGRQPSWYVYLSESKIFQVCDHEANRMLLKAREETGMAKRALEAYKLRNPQQGGKA